MRFARELRRRRVFTTAGLYVVGAWLVMQAADVFFPGWDIPDKAINLLLVAAVVGFPVVLVFGWFFNITAHGIVRTLPAGGDQAGHSRPLKGNDYLVLAALVVIASAIISHATVRVLSLRGSTDAPVAVEKLQNSVAVLPFANISTNPDNEIFSDGISEEIRNRLGHHSELKVIARTSSFQFKGSEYGIPRISQLLGVQFLLQGSVRRDGDRIRVSAQLVRDNGTQLWSKNYDRLLADVFGIQDEIADLVAAEVAPQIVSGLQDSYRPSLEAYKHFLAGREFIHRRNRVAAQRELEKAVELEPEYAEAQAEYAISLLLGYPDEDMIRKADAAIDKALRLVDGLPRALAARGLYFGQRSPADLAAQEAILRRALEADPNMVDAMNWLAGSLMVQGRRAEASEWQEKAYAIDPFNGAIAANAANQLWEKGEPARAEAMLRRLVDLPSPPLMAYAQLYEFYMDFGRLVDANRTGRQYLLAGGWFNVLLGDNYATLGQFEAAAYLAAATVRDYPDQLWVRTGWVQAQPAYWRGQFAEAVEEMRGALAGTGTSLSELPNELGWFYGLNQALAGDFAGAIATLAPRAPSSVDQEVMESYWGLDACQALAWVYTRSGSPNDARQILDLVEQWLADRGEVEETLKSSELYKAARNAVLIGNVALALDRLEQAIDAGWRAYYVNRNDPRWDAMKDDAKYQALMARVKADVDRQRAEVERIDAEEDLPALLERARKTRESAAAQGGG